MKAVVTIINDYGEVVEKDKIIAPFDEYITYNPKDMVTTKSSWFKFCITEALNQHQKIYFPNDKSEG